MPMTTPFRSTSGPPLLPGLIAASVWIRRTVPTSRMALTMPRGHRVREHAKRGANRDDFLSRERRLTQIESEDRLFGIGVVDLKDSQVAALRNRHNSRDVCGLADLELAWALAVNHVRVGEHLIVANEEPVRTRLPGGNRCDGRQHAADHLFERCGWRLCRRGCVHRGRRRRSETPAVVAGPASCWLPGSKRSRTEVASSRRLGNSNRGRVNWRRAGPRQHEDEASANHESACEQEKCVCFR